MIALRKLALSIAAVAVAAFTPVAAVASATPMPTVPDILVVQIPAIGGLEVGPGGVPGGSFAPVNVDVQRAQIYTLQYPPAPPSIIVSVRNPAPYATQYSYRYLSVSWRNVTTGKSGHVDLRHWRTPTFRVAGYPASLPTTAVAQTGGGVVTVTVNVMREQYQAPPSTISVVHGLSALVL